MISLAFLLLPAFVYNAQFLIMVMRFWDRVEAGDRLSGLLRSYPRQESVILTPLNESIVIGRTVSKRLAIPIDLLTVSSLHHPYHWEEVIGAVSLEDILLTRSEHEACVAEVIPLVRKRLMERTFLLKKGRLFQTVKNKTVIVITEGCRTGLKLAPTLRLLARQRPLRIVVAAPVMASEAIRRLRLSADDVHSLYTPMPYESTGAFFQNFRLYSDDELSAKLL